MKMKKITLFPLVLIFGIIAACTSELDLTPETMESPIMQEKNSNSILNQDLAKARKATAAFHDFDKAEAAGYDTPISPCVEVPGLGGMGYHYANFANFDGTVDIENPEVLLYEPQEDGSLKLVGIEYIVPLDAWSGSEAPELFGQHFHKNEGLGIWALHVWIWSDNPDGMFADFNPKVSCQYEFE